jgi:hypothetical protein
MINDLASYYSFALKNRINTNASSLPLQANQQHNSIFLVDERTIDQMMSRRSVDNAPMI